MPRRKKIPAHTLHMMEYAAREGIGDVGAADDMPLFSGQPVTVHPSPFRPRPVAKQETLFDIRHDPFNVRDKPDTSPPDQEHAPMQTIDDVRRRLRLELIHWQPLQIREPLTRFYLFYTPQTAEHDSGLLIAREHPRQDYEYVTPAHLDRSATVDQLYAQLEPLLHKLPILTTR